MSLATWGRRMLIFQGHGQADLRSEASRRRLPRNMQECTSCKACITKDKHREGALPIADCGDAVLQPYSWLLRTKTTTPPISGF